MSVQKQDHIDLSTIVREATDWAISCRRKLHEWPELGLLEFETQKKVEAALESFGLYTERIWKTSVMATLQGTGGGPYMVFRADMDGLPLKETTACDFASKREGMMHGCGHDVHMAVLLGTAKVLSQLSHRFSGDIRFLFQPAEETSGGAQEMIKHGCLAFKTQDGRAKKADCVFGLHVKPELAAGTIGLKYGVVHASSDLFRIVVRGKSCHGAHPHRGIDAMLYAAQLICEAQSIVARNVDPLDSAVITFGTITGGTARNIIADTVFIEGTIRTLKFETRDLVKKRLANMVKWVAAAGGAMAEIEFEEGYTSLINHDKALDEVKASIQEFCRIDTELSVQNCETIKLVELSTPTMGVDDFSYFTKETEGAFLFLGSGFSGVENPGLHTSKFCVNEECIKTGIKTLTAIALKYNHLLY